MFSVFLEVGSMAVYFGRLLEAFWVILQEKNGEIKMCLPTRREVASSLLRASLFVGTLYKQERVWRELCAKLLLHQNSSVLCFRCVDLVRVSHGWISISEMVQCLRWFGFCVLSVRFLFPPAFLLIISAVWKIWSAICLLFSLLSCSTKAQCHYPWIYIYVFNKFTLTALHRVLDWW